MTTAKSCPCGSGLALSVCCEPVISGKEKARSAEALLRSRYTAFTLGKVDYILSTHHSRTRDQVNREEIEEWSSKSQWQGFELLAKEAGEEKDDRGVIAFQVRYSMEGKDYLHGEQSLFEREDGQWKFVDAQPLKVGTYRREEPKLGRNDPCKCGSGKKFKKCCGA